MFKNLIGWWRMIFTHKDNVTHDLAKYLAALAVLEFVVLAAWSVLHNHSQFDMQNFGIGAGSTFGGLAAYLGLRKEPNVNNP